MNYGTYDHGYGETWQDVLVYGKEGYTTSVADYHSHGFYEVNLIFSGNIRILLADQSVETNMSHLVLTGPGVPHFIACHPDTLYQRLYLCFSAEFMEQGGPEWVHFRRMFEGNGSVVTITGEQCGLCEKLIDAIGKESDRYRCRLLTLYLLSQIFGIRKEGGAAVTPAPACVIGALSYIHKHYTDHLVAEELAARLHVGRTTLMTAFKKHTGTTLNEYIAGFRVKQAGRALAQGKTVQEAAESCGFSDSGTMIRAFHRYMGMTPGQYRRSKCK